MKKIGIALLAVMASSMAMADSYTVGQQVVSPQYALNLVSTGTAPKIDQIAQNVGNTAIIKDLDGYGGDSYSSNQKVTAFQLSRNTIDVHSVAGKTDQLAVNFGSDLDIKDVGGAGGWFGPDPQTVNAHQLQSGTQEAHNIIDMSHSGNIVQVASNTGNNINIDLPTTLSINTVVTAQSVSANQLSSNVINVSGGWFSGGYTGNVSQTAANLGNAVKIVQ